MTHLTVADIRVGCHVYETSGLDDMADDVPDRRRHGTVIPNHRLAPGLVEFWDVAPVPKPTKNYYRYFPRLEQHVLPATSLELVDDGGATTNSNFDFYQRVCAYTAHTPGLTPTTCAALTRTALEILGAG